MPITALPINTKLADKSDVGLGNVDNTSDANKPVSTAQAAAIALKADSAATTAALATKAATTDLTAHTANTSNPHGVTKTQVGLSNVDNTADLSKPISTATQAALTPLQALAGKVPVNSQAADYTAAASDAGKRIAMNGAGTLSLPDNTQVPIPVDSWFYVSPGAVVAIAPLAGGSASISIEAGLSLSPLVVNAVYLVVKSSTDGWTVAKVGGGSVINDLTTGGTGVPLSAEQGKQLNLKKLSAVNGVPAATGADVFTVRMDKPFRGVLYSESGGLVAALDNTYTWATRPDATTCAGSVITISDWNQDFFSDGTNWIPVGKRLAFLSAVARLASSVGTGANVTVVTDTIPAGLVVANCRVKFEGLYEFAGTAAVKTMKIGHLGDMAVSIQSTAASVSARLEKTIYVQNAANLTRWYANAASNADASGTSTAVTESANYNWTASVAIDWVQNMTSPDSVVICARAIEIVYP